MMTENDIYARLRSGKKAKYLVVVKEEEALEVANDWDGKLTFLRTLMQGHAEQQNDFLN